MSSERVLVELLGVALAGETGLEVVGHAGSAREALLVVEVLAPDLVLLDDQLRPSPEDGRALCTALVQSTTRPLVVVLTSVADRDVVRRAASVGAAGVVPRCTALSELFDVLRCVRPDGLVLHPALLRSLVPPAPRPTTRPTVLTSREQQVLDRLEAGADASRIARDLGISVHTCRGYIKALLMKLNAHNQREAVAIASRQGLVRGGSGSEDPRALT